MLTALITAFFSVRIAVWIGYINTMFKKKSKSCLYILLTMRDVTIHSNQDARMRKPTSVLKVGFETSGNQKMIGWQYILISTK